MTRRTIAEIKAKIAELDAPPPRRATQTTRVIRSMMAEALRWSIGEHVDQDLLNDGKRTEPSER